MPHYAIGEQIGRHHIVPGVSNPFFDVRYIMRREGYRWLKDGTCMSNDDWAKRVGVREG